MAIRIPREVDLGQRLACKRLIKEGLSNELPEKSGLGRRGKPEAGKGQD